MPCRQIHLWTYVPFEPDQVQIVWYHTFMHACEMLTGKHLTWVISSELLLCTICFRAITSLLSDQLYMTDPVDLEWISFQTAINSPSKVNYRRLLRLYYLYVGMSVNTDHRLLIYMHSVISMSSKWHLKIHNSSWLIQTDYLPCTDHGNHDDLRSISDLSACADEVEQFCDLECRYSFNGSNSQADASWTSSVLL